LISFRPLYARKVAGKSPRHPPAATEMAKIPPALRWLLLAVLIGAGLALPKWLGSRAKSSAADVEPVVEERLPVRVETVEPGPLEELLITTGTVLANEQIDLVSEISGKVEEILFREGSVVEAGAVLVKLDTSTLSAERERARHRFELVQRQEARQQELLDEGLISEDEYESTLSQLNVLQAELLLSEVELEKAEIRAPFSGIIGLRAVSLGSYVSSQTRLTTLQDIDPVKVEFSVPEAYARDLAVGDPVRFRIKGLDDEFLGRVYALEPAIDLETRSLTLRATAPNPEGTLLPGAFAEVRVAVREVSEALSVPAIAVVPELGGKKIFVLEEGLAQPRVVETGIRTDTRVQITRGLEPGERVIVSNIPRLRAGIAVEVEGEGNQ
ncbi:MAG: efflux RND transporter periplasmic adaptor subunit, partial [Thermoanaerobaculia bacterium]